MEWLYYLLGAAVAVLIIVGALLLRRHSLHRQGIYAKRKATAALKKYALLRYYKVLTDLELPAAGPAGSSRTVKIENVLVGFFGLLVVTSIDRKGEFYGKRTDKSWTYMLNGEKNALSREMVPNPIVQNQEVLAALREILSKEKVYNIPMEAIVVVAGNSKRTKLYISNCPEMFYLKELTKYLAKSKFDKDSQVDVEKLSELLGRYAVSSGR